MNKHLTAFLTGITLVLGVSAHAADPSCKQLQDDSNLIYAAKGFCFKDPEAKAKYGNENCFTTKPKFSDKEQQRLNEIQQRQKELNCN